MTAIVTRIVPAHCRVVPHYRDIAPHVANLLVSASLPISRSRLSSTLSKVGFRVKDLSHCTPEDDMKANRMEDHDQKKISRFNRTVAQMLHPPRVDLR